MKIKTGWLYLPSTESRWVIVYKTSEGLDYDTLTSGSIFEVQIGSKWIRTSMEHNGKVYYPTTNGIKLENMLKARQVLE